jgi:hypothetical protein
MELQWQITACPDESPGLGSNDHLRIRTIFDRELRRTVDGAWGIYSPARAIPAKVGTGFASGIASQQRDRAFPVNRISPEML